MPVFFSRRVRTEVVPSRRCERNQDDAAKHAWRAAIYGATSSRVRRRFACPRASRVCCSEPRARTPVDADASARDDDIVGSIDLLSILRGILQSAMLGYSVDATREGRGYATEGARAVVRFAFDERPRCSKDRICRRRICARLSLSQRCLARRHSRFTDERALAPGVKGGNRGEAMTSARRALRDGLRAERDGRATVA